MKVLCRRFGLETIKRAASVMCRGQEIIYYGDYVEMCPKYKWKLLSYIHMMFLHVHATSYGEN